MRVIARLGREDIATVYIAQMEDGRRIEFVESVDPPIPRERKWVTIISTLFGCPVRCPICDAGRDYSGKLSFEDMMFQIGYLVDLRFPTGRIPVDKWKIQFARMGDPAFNPSVLDVLESLPKRYDAPGLMPSISTIAPESTELFFERLKDIKARLYPKRFQFQFSIHSTDPVVRRRLIPVRTWEFGRMAEYGEQFFEPGGRKIGLNFALMADAQIDPLVIERYFNPDVFLIKMTPLNPTLSVAANNIEPKPVDCPDTLNLVESLKKAGFEVIVSIGELEENAIGSNCGQYVSTLEEMAVTSDDAYVYPLEAL